MVVIIQMINCYVFPLRRNQGSALWLHYCFLTALPLFLHSLSSLISNCLNLPFGIQGQSRKLRASQVALAVKNPPASAGGIRYAASIPGLGRFPGGGHSNPLQYSCLENLMDWGAWWTTVHRVPESWTWLNTHTRTQGIIWSCLEICHNQMCWGEQCYWHLEGQDQGCC